MWEVRQSLDVIFGDQQYMTRKKRPMIQESEAGLALEDHRRGYAPMRYVTENTAHREFRFMPIGGNWPRARHNEAGN
jgi:hypothetical protein